MATRKATTKQKAVANRKQAPTAKRTSAPKRASAPKTASKPKRTPKPAGVPKPIEIHRDKYTELFAECYAEFEASGFDTRLLNGQHLRIADHFIAIAKAEGRPDNWAYKTWEHDWRMFLEYALRRIPKDDTVLRDLLLERVRDTWEKQRFDSLKKHHMKVLDEFDRVLNNALIGTVYNVIEELQAYKVIPLERLAIQEDGTPILPGKTEDKQYNFGYVHDGVLTWTGVLNQLARAIHIVEPQLRYDGLASSEVCKRVEDSGVITLARGKFTTVEKALDKLRINKADFGAEDYIPEAAGLILSLLKK